MIFRLIAAVAGREMASAALRTRRIQLSLKIQQLAHKVEVGRNVGLFSAHKVVRVVQTHRHFVHQISLVQKRKRQKQNKKRELENIISGPIPKGLFICQLTTVMVTEREIPARQWTRTPSCRSRAPSNGNQISIKRMINLSLSSSPAEHAHDLVLNGILIHKRRERERKEGELNKKKKGKKKE